MNKVLRYGMVGGGPGSFIGDAHRRAIALDSTAQLVAGVFSSHPEKSRQTAQELGVGPGPLLRRLLGDGGEGSGPGGTASTLWWW